MPLQSRTGLQIYPHSHAKTHGVAYSLARSPNGERFLMLVGSAEEFEVEEDIQEGAHLCPLTHANAVAIRQRLPWLNPVPLGLISSMGLGDRLGLATPGHIQSIRKASIMPVFAQQSVRENARTGRSPEQVLDDATWGVLQEGFREPWGADADHLKSIDDLEPFVQAGYTFFTVDPGEHVQSVNPAWSTSELREKAETLPWGRLDTSLEDLYSRYLNRSFSLDGLTLEFDEQTLLRAACKYGYAIAHVAEMYDRLCSMMDGRPFDFEISLDETEIPTTTAEHFLIAAELKRLNVSWTSLALRFNGSFQKGIDFIGNPTDFEVEIRQHTTISRYWGDYKLSLHSGSDKFSIYPCLVRGTRGRFHVKTAGTSYLEALRTLASLDPGLFRDIFLLSCSLYEIDRASYHVSATLDDSLVLEDLTEPALSLLLNDVNFRQVLHVTFGSVLKQYGAQLKAALLAHEAAYHDQLEKHFDRHISALATGLS